MSIKIHLSTTWKIVGMFAIGLVCFPTGAECKRSACWRYGHVCWGGHGKRSEQPPLMPLSAANNNIDVGELSPKEWNILESDRQWKLYPKSLMPTTLSTFNPQIRQPLTYMNNFNGKEQGPPILVMQLNKPSQMGTPVRNLPTFDQSGSRFKINQRVQSDDSEERNALDDSLVISDPGTSAKSSTSHEVFPASRASLSEAFKRNAIEEGMSGTNGGTEEPLETSSNGMDSDSVATFFRDRKSAGKRVAAESYTHERYPNMHLGNIKDNMVAFPRQLKFNNIFDVLPLSQVRPAKIAFPKKKFYI